MIKPKHSFSADETARSGTFPALFTSSVNAISVYTALCILRAMKTRLGLEAMLEYAQNYLHAMEKRDPALKNAAAKVISALDLEAIFGKGMM